MCYTSTTYPQKLKNIPVKVDSAALGHYWRGEDAQCLKNVKLKLGLQVTLPNNSSVQVIKQVHFPLDSSLTAKAASAAIIPSLKSVSLISLGQLFDDDFQVLLDKKKLVVTQKKSMILHGNRNQSDGLWDIKISYYEVYKRNPPTHVAIYLGNAKACTATTKQIIPKKHKKNLHQFI